jgi:hypothetical protein
VDVAECIVVDCDSWLLLPPHGSSGSVDVAALKAGWRHCDKQARFLAVRAGGARVRILPRPLDEQSVVESVSIFAQRS